MTRPSEEPEKLPLHSRFVQRFLNFDRPWGVFDKVLSTLPCPLFAVRPGQGPRREMGRRFSP